MIIGLANTLPQALSSGLQAQGVSAQVSHEVANLPPVGSLFAAFLGYNPIAELLAPSHALNQPGVNADVLTGKSFFPELISGPFRSGLQAAFAFAIFACLVAAAASLMRGGMYHHDDTTTEEQNADPVVRAVSVRT